MTGDSADLTVRLEELTQAPAPPSSIDIARARVQGRRSLRRRRAAWLGATASALAILTSVIALPGHGTALLGPPAHSATTMPRPTTAAGRDPLVAPAAFGWLPASIAGVGYLRGFETGLPGTTVQAVGRGQWAPRILLTLYPTGVTPRLGSFASGAPQVKVPAPPVHERSAYWLTSQASDPTNQGDAYLRWQTADGRWAEIHAYYLPATDLQSVLLRVADGVAVRDTAVPLPLHISGLPADFQLNETDLNRPELGGHGAWRLWMVYGVKVGAREADVSIVVRPALGAPGPENGSTCTTANGLSLCIAVDRGPVPSLTAIGGIQGLQRRITLLGADERNWTTSLLD